MISTPKLKTFLSLHLAPIYLVVFEVSYFLKNGKSYLEGGFVLRCFQLLSFPNLATRLCSWQSNRCTIGLSIPVLSY